MKPSMSSLGDLDNDCFPSPPHLLCTYSWVQMNLEVELGSQELCVWFPPFQSFQPLTLESCTLDLLLNVRDVKKNETESSLDQEGPKEEDDPAPPKPTSARHYSSVPDLRNSSFLSCSGLELSKPIFRIKEAKSASAVNIFTGTVVSGVVVVPEGRAREVVMGVLLSCPFSIPDVLWPFE